ncbi:MAG TPA: hypothetical protein VN279_13620, partial [Rhodocyclaceae bacterium]|nr:hypothetical protein [Rhodocyclaceae bacterium]
MTSDRPNPLWRAYEYVAMALGLGALALVCLLWLPFAAQAIEPFEVEAAGAERLQEREIGPESARDRPAPET